MLGKLKLKGLDFEEMDLETDTLKMLKNTFDEPERITRDISKREPNGVLMKYGGK